MQHSNFITSNIIKSFYLGIILIFMACHSNSQNVTAVVDPTSAATKPIIKPNPKNVVQLALLLDVSNSMDGLIGQAKAELWNIVNEVSKATKNGQTANLQIALYEYGRDNNNADKGFVKQLLNYTSDLDTISQVLFGVQTNGGEEYCGWAINCSLDELKWNNLDSVYRVIFIAGNEPFTQGAISYKTSCTRALNKKIFVNTIHCGDENTGISQGWKDGASITHGDYFFINQNERIIEMATPYDITINNLNDSINTTYLGYGSTGQSKSINQVLQDANAESLSSSAKINRTISKSSAVYKNESWDLVDASKTDEEFIAKANEDELPVELKGKKLEEKKVIIQQKSKERDCYTLKVNKLAVQRQQYIQQHQKNPSANTLGNSIIKAIRKQAAQNGFVFVEMKG
jgi:hypothetical protein